MSFSDSWCPDGSQDSQPLVGFIWWWQAGLGWRCTTEPGGLSRAFWHRTMCPCHQGKYEFGLKMFPPIVFFVCLCVCTTPLLTAVPFFAAQGFTTGRHYWEVDVGDKTAWDVGVVRQSVSRKGVVTLTPEDGYWTICLRRGSQYRACARQAELLHLLQRPRIVGVFFDYEDGTVSFFDAETHAHMYSFTNFPFTEAIFPFFNPDITDSESNKSPLVIRALCEDRDLDGITI